MCFKIYIAYIYNYVVYFNFTELGYMDKTVMLPKFIFSQVRPFILGPTHNINMIDLSLPRPTQ